jgi:glutamate synthase (NADPH/NADH) small chain
VHAALDYLIASNRVGFGDDVPAYADGSLNAAGKAVVVIGGGDTAMDCVRTAIRQGAKSVTCLYRRDRENMPGSQREVQNAEEEGVVFEWLAAPEAVLHARGGKVRGVRASRMRLGEPDASGRRSPLPGGESFEVKADMVIKALGFDAEDLPRLFNAPGLTVTQWGTLVLDPRNNTVRGMPGVYAAGDIVRGASLVVWAIRDGRDMADAIHKSLDTHARSGALQAAE